MGKLWGGRFESGTDPLMEEFNDSISFDKRLWKADIQGSEAWVRALTRIGLLSPPEAEVLLNGLGRVREEWESGEFQIKPGDEDIHTANERRLKELVGDVAGKLHTGRSRNDQVATDVRLFLRDEIDELEKLLIELQRAALDVAEENLSVIMPGYTHLQRAQPVRFSHWMMSYFWMWQRDRERLWEVRRRVNVLPLGSGALAGTPFPVDRKALAADLGFATVSENSMDAVADRDFVIEMLSWGAMLGVHMSRLAEDLILWSSAEFGFVTMADAYSTGSSLMPQKKNPDALELIRGKSGRLVGNLLKLMVVMKGIPSTYDKDLQEDKEPLFDTIDTVKMIVQIAAGVISTMSLNEDRMKSALSDDLLATDLADYLVRKGVPFREGHEIVGKVVRLAEEKGVSLSELSLDDLRSISDKFQGDVLDVWDFEASVEKRSVRGGTALASVREQIKRARQLLLTRP
jgi:argininosuccinate lyase